MNVIGHYGYFLFGTLIFHNISGDLLENYCKDDDLMNAARFGFAITIMLTYPIECFVTREVSEFI